ncbi:MAG TPA: UDP-glucose 4-epimerase GalE [Burkholderiales bacterium]
MGKTILVTGGTGYIGSHTVVALLDAGYTPLIIDNLHNSSCAVLPRVEKICGVRPEFIEGDVRDSALLRKIFGEREVAAVIHFAAHKAVGESVTQPLMYYENNLVGMTHLLQAMQEAKLYNFVFSSSCTVYGEPDTVPIVETAPLSAVNPYGRTKLLGEQMLGDLMLAQAQWRCAILRYFNPVGAHESGLIGEAPNGIPNNLMPYITQVAVGKRERLAIFGSDYPTTDGTGVRDYIHVMDLAQGHVAALDYLLKNGQSLTVNLGTGQGVSVLQLVTAFEKATGIAIARTLAPRRPGDAIEVYADASKMKQLTGWEARRTVLQMCQDAWRWQSGNPEGYQ